MALSESATAGDIDVAAVGFVESTRNATAFEPAAVVAFDRVIAALLLRNVVEVVYEAVKFSRCLSLS